MRNPVAQIPTSASQLPQSGAMILNGINFMNIQSVFALIQRELQWTYYSHNQNRPERIRLFRMQLTHLTGPSVYSPAQNSCFQFSLPKNVSVRMANRLSCLNSGQ